MWCLAAMKRLYWICGEVVRRWGWDVPRKIGLSLSQGARLVFAPVRAWRML